MKQKLENYIREFFPDAIIEDYFNSRWGYEMIFYPCQGADEFTCIYKGGSFKILTDF